MRLITILLTLIMTLSSDNGRLMLFDFSNSASLSSWRVVDDGVMGGLSQGNLYINEAGHGCFHGDVSLDNNGGFSSLRYYLEEVKVNDFTKISIVLKGDGKDYQIRLKSKRYDRHSYTMAISTSKEWQTIEILLSDMTPTFRGRQLDIPNFPGATLSEFAILIGNKRAESFQLEIDTIFLT